MTELIWYCHTCNVWYPTIDGDHEEQPAGFLTCDWREER